MSTLKVNDITKINSDPLLSGRVVTTAQYVDQTFKSNTAPGGSLPVGTTLFTMPFDKKYSASISHVIGIWSVNSVRQGSEAQHYGAYRGPTKVGEYIVRHGNTGWTSGCDSFTWKDTGANAGTISYSLVIINYVSNFYYNHPSNFSGSPNCISNFTIMEILN